MQQFEIPVLQFDGEKLVRITPTDVAQFIRFEQCERFLRLQLHARNRDYDFLHHNGMKPQGIPPLLTTSGSDWENVIETELDSRCDEVSAQGNSASSSVQSGTKKINFAARSSSGDRRRDPDNDEIVKIARDLKAGQTVWLLQPRVVVPLGAWQMRGDMDILRLSRDANGALQVLIADMKSSSRSKHEHKLQVAFYHHMMRELLGSANIAHERIELGIAYRGPHDGGAAADIETQNLLQTHRENARGVLGLEVGYFDVMTESERAAFFNAVDELVLHPESTATRIASQAPYRDLNFNLGYKCDGCTFNAWCMKTSAHDDDLSVLPHLDDDLKDALHKAGVHTVTELADLKRLKTGTRELEIVPENDAMVRKLSATRGVGARLDELIHRALAFRDARARQLEHLGLPRVPHLTYIPSKGYGSLPYCDASQNPNLVTLFIDSQFDYLQERLCAVSTLVVAHEEGEVKEARPHVLLCDGPPKTDADEQRLLEDWIGGVLNSVVELAAPNEDGESKAPVHLVFFNKIEQKTLLEALGRHFSDVVAATPLYDFVTQIASLDGAMVSFLDEELRELKNIPRTCASLYEVAQVLWTRENERFEWSPDSKMRFHERVFDGWGAIEHLDDGREWVQSKARFSSHLPLEYAYAAWNALPVYDPKKHGKDDSFAPFRDVSREQWLAFNIERLRALHHIANCFEGNRQTEKSAFDLTSIHTQQNKAANLAQAMHEFLVLERHADLGGWKQARLAPPERRALAGDTLVCKYLQSDQTPEIQALIAQNAQNEIELAQWRAENPDKNKPRGQFKIDYQMELRLRLESSGSHVNAHEVLALTTLRAGESIVLSPRWDFDSRLPAAEQKPYTPTPKAMLYDMRADLVSIERENDTVWVTVRILPPMGCNEKARGWVFRAHNSALQDGELYALDSNPNDWMGAFGVEVIHGLRDGEPNALYQRLQTRSDAANAHFDWPDAARIGQERFLAGLNELAKTDSNYIFEPSKQEFIGSHGAAPWLLVQGPPGTGKSYATSWALWARLQGALCANRDLRIILSCKTHAATDVLLRNLRDAREKLQDVQQTHPELFAKYFEAALFEIPLWRFDYDRRKTGANEADAAHSDRDLVLLAREGENRSENPNGERTDKLILQASRGVFASTPGGVYRLCKDAQGSGKNKASLFEREWFDMLVIDEASQMNLPEAMLAALPLKTDFALIVVGDPRQMPPIVKNDWRNETRRTFAEFKVFASLYDSIQALNDATPSGEEQLVPRIAFEESFRLHRDMAEFLRREIYAQDGIHYHSKRDKVLAQHNHHDDFVRAVLDPQHSLIVITHDESQSVLENATEAALIRPILEALSHADWHNLNRNHGLGIVVPHRAQRALLQDERWYVETVEKYQGDERDAMIFCATESDRAYLSKGGFLFDPRRLNVALSRAKRKMILVAGRTVFEGFHADEETFNNAQLWKNLLRHTCNVDLHREVRDGVTVQVWGNDLSLTA